MSIIQITNGSFDTEKHEYFSANGKEVPGVTAILEAHGFVDLDDIPNQVLLRKRDLGDAVHFASAIIDEGGEDALDWDTVHPACVPFVLAYQRFVEDCQFVPEKGWIERGIVGNINGMPVAGTPDRIGRMKGISHRIVLDLKCAYAAQASWKFQESAYVALVQAIEGTKEHLARVTVQLKPDATFKLHPYENPRDIDTFVYSLAITHALINEKLPWRKSERL